MNEHITPGIDWSPWMFNGMLSTQKFPNGNILSYSAQAAFFAGLSQYDPPIRSHRVSTGVFSRYSDRLSNTQIDDLVSLACLQEYAWEIRYTLWKNWGFLDVHAPTQASWNWTQWFYRFPALLAHLDFSLNDRPALFKQVAWAVSMFISANKPHADQDNWMQSHLMALVYMRSTEKTDLCDRALNYWISKKPQNMKTVVASYIGTYEHPLVALWLS